MNTYHKINTVFKRDEKGNLLIGEFSISEFDYLKNNEWIGTEKVDGTNIRVIYDGLNKTVEFRGKTDNADLHPTLLKNLSNLFNIQKFYNIFGETSVCLYGEGYGNKIQSCGKRYISESNSFILFDIKIGNYWLRFGDVEEIASKMNINVVPRVYTGTLLDAIELFKRKETFISNISEDRNLIAEGLVLKPAIELFSRNGDRIITKLKYKDFK